MGPKKWSGSGGKIEIPSSAENRALVIYVGLEVLRAEVMKSSIYWDITALYHNVYSIVCRLIG